MYMEANNSPSVSAERQLPRFFAFVFLFLSSRLFGDREVRRPADKMESTAGETLKSETFLAHSCAEPAQVRLSLSLDFHSACKSIQSLIVVCIPICPPPRRVESHAIAHPSSLAALVCKCRYRHGLHLCTPPEDEIKLNRQFVHPAASFLRKVLYVNMQRGVGSSLFYKNTTDAFAKIVRLEGAKALYKGFTIVARYPDRPVSSSSCAVVTPFQESTRAASNY